MDKDTTTKLTETNEIYRIFFYPNRIDFTLYHYYGLTSYVIVELVNAYNLWIDKN